jgi:trimethylamine:corrinoid methyltransferase-like protein
VEVGKDRYRGDRFRFVTETAPFELKGKNPEPIHHKENTMIHTFASLLSQAQVERVHSASLEILDVTGIAGA